MSRNLLTYYLPVLLTGGVAAATYAYKFQKPAASLSGPKRVQRFTAQRIIFESSMPAGAIIAAIEQEIRQDVFNNFDFASLAIPAVVSGNKAAFEAAVDSKIGPIGFMSVRCFFSTNETLKHFSGIFPGCSTYLPTKAL